MPPPGKARSPQQGRRASSPAATKIHAECASSSSVGPGLRPRCRQEENYDDDDSADHHPLPESGLLLRIMLRHNFFHVSAGKPTGLFGSVDLSGAELAD